MSKRNLLFFSGIGMQPSAILDAYPGATFIARARVEADPVEVSSFFSDALPRGDGTVTVWGLAVQSQQPIEGERRNGRSDEDKELELTLAASPLLDGNPEEVLAAALYWELPPAYTAILREAAGVAAPEAEGGWESPVLEAEPPAPES